MSISLALEREVAIAAVRRACTLTSAVFNKLVKNETLTKGDKSPVTVADFSAQAVVNTILARAYPKDPIVGEEDSADLRGDSPTATTLRERVVALANESLTAELGKGDMVQWGLGPGEARTSEELLAAIDRGNFEGGRTGRMWTLDPIDGTKGFLRGEQYAVCLALIINAQVELGVMGCPNLPQDASQPDGPRGCLFVAVRGQGAEQMTLSGANPQRLSIPSSLSLSSINSLESVEAAHASHSFNDRVAETMGVTRAPTRMDSQAKYGALARGDGGVYLRMPTGVGYREKIWDHAGGSLLVEEAGGRVSDSRGQPLDFGLGRTLGENFGVVAAGAEVHSKVLEAIKKVKEEEAKL